MSGVDLYLSQSVFLAMLAVSAAAGMGLGILYDILVFLRLLLHVPLPRRFAKERAPREDGITDGTWEIPDQAPPETAGTAPRTLPLTPGFTGDLLFMLFAALTLTLLVYYTNDGVLRAPAVVGLTVGFGTWYGTVGRLLRRCALPLSDGIKRIFIGLMRILWSPIRWAVRPPVRLLRRILRRLAGKHRPVESGEVPCKDCNG